MKQRSFLTGSEGKGIDWNKEELLEQKVVAGGNGCSTAERLRRISICVACSFISQVQILVHLYFAVRSLRF